MILFQILTTGDKERSEKMKKLFMSVSVVFLLVALTACGGPPSSNYGYPYKSEEGTIQTEADLSKAVDSAEQTLDGNVLTVTVHLRSEWEGKVRIACYLMQGQESVFREGYQDEGQFTFSDLEPGEYWAKYFLEYGDLRKSYPMEGITVTAESGGEIEEVQEPYTEG